MIMSCSLPLVGVRFRADQREANAKLEKSV
jgi:hypothetical protein